MADEAAEGDVVVGLVGEDFLEDGGAGVVAELLDLLAVAGDVAALVEFEAAECEALAADAVGERAGFAGFGALVLGNRRAEGGEARGPEVGVMLLGQGEVAQGAAALGLGFLLGERVVGVVAAHLRLPVAGEGFDQTFCVFGIHCAAARRVALLQSGSPCQCCESVLAGLRMRRE